ncbi:MAG: hypothetical protein AB7V39_02975 [Nitrospiraceae bacterium]
MTSIAVAGGGSESLVTPTTHASINHSGVPGVGDLTTAAHASLSHTGIPGVGDLTTAAHASLGHTGIPGIGNFGASTFVFFSPSLPATDTGSAGLVVVPASVASGLTDLVMPHAGVITAISARRLTHLTANLVLNIKKNGGIVDSSFNEAPGTTNQRRVVSVTFAALDTISVDFDVTTGTWSGLVYLAVRYTSNG